MVLKKSYLLLLSSLLSTGVFAQTAEVHAVNAGRQGTMVSDHHQQPPVYFSTILADSTGATHIGKCKFEGLSFKSYAPPAAPQWIGISPDQIQSIAYAILPPGYTGTWHHAPGPQWVITLSGKWSVESTDGTVLTQGPGGIQFNGDSSSKPRADDKRVGHLSRTVGDQPNVQLIIKLKPGVKTNAMYSSCAG